MRFLLASLLGLATTVAALPTYTRHAAPQGWTLGERAPGTAPVSFMLALTQRNLDRLNTVFTSVSDPQSSNYRNFLSKEEILAIVAPSDEDRATVKRWLARHGVHGCQDLGDALKCQTTVKVASALFHTSFHTYTNTDDTDVKIVRTFGKYSVASEVEPLINMVEGIASFPIAHYRTHHHSSTKKAGAEPFGIIAQSLQSLYSVPTKLGLSTNTSQGVIEFEGESFSPKDLAEYSKLVDIPIMSPGKNTTVGPNDPNGAGDESTLDVDMMFSLNPEAENWFWLQPGNDWLYAYASQFFSTDVVPQVVSISYGWSEADQCSINKDECKKLGVDNIGYVERVNTEFQKIGLRGVTLIVASGDSGVNGRTDPGCTKKQFFPDFPACSPYVLSVGATELADPVAKLPSPPPVCSGHHYECASDGKEQAVSFKISSFASGGGFSNVSPQPSWQSDAVAAYFKSGVSMPPASYYNATSRGYPDVAAQGNNILIYESGLEPVGGTSASAPIWGAVIALLNQAAMQKDGNPLGFVNPLLYQIAASTPDAFKDITVGDNICTEDGCAKECKGFEATVGWDPVTGLGAPNFPNLLAAVQNTL